MQATDATNASNRCNHGQHISKLFKGKWSRKGCIGCLHRLHRLPASVASAGVTNATDASNQCNRYKQPMQPLAAYFQSISRENGQELLAPVARFGLHRLLASVALVARFRLVNSAQLRSATDASNRCKQPMQATDATLGGTFSTNFLWKCAVRGCIGCLHWLLRNRIEIVLIMQRSNHAEIEQPMQATDATNASNRCSLFLTIFL